jgi:hypothetical protein
MASASVKAKRRFSIILALLLFLTSIPITPSILAADESQESPVITLLAPVVNPGNSAANPYLVYDSRLTLTGTLNENSNEIMNLRIRMKQAGDKDWIEQKNIHPTVQSNIFTFTDIILKPGLNAISFYIERGGSSYVYPYTVYIQYNNTPFLADLKINGTLLNPPWTDHPTVVTVPSTSRLRAGMDGTAKNADSLVVKNTTTGDSVTTSVNKTGMFSINVPVELGWNELEIRGVSNNKEVTLERYKIIVTTSDENNADQFYQVKITNVTESGSNPNYKPIVLNPKTPVVVIGDMDNKLRIDGEALLKFVEVADQKEMDSIKLNILDNNGNLKGSFDVTAPGQPSGQAGYTSYKISSTEFTPSALNLVDGETYQIELAYVYNEIKKDSAGNKVPSPKPKTVNNYRYKFIFGDDSQPRFDELYNITNSESGVLLSPYYENVITDPIPTLRLNIHNITISNINNGHIKIKYNNNILDKNKGDYNEAPGAGTEPEFIDYTLYKIPTGSGVLEFIFNDGITEKKISYKINLVVTPYIYATYEYNGETISIEDSFQYTPNLDDLTLNLKVYNYNLQSGSFKITINGSEITESTSNDGYILTPNNPPNTPGNIAIPFSVIKGKLRPGNNQLVVQLTRNPIVTFTYNIAYLNSTTPSISDVKLWIGDAELTKDPADTSYRTDSLFLNKFTFNVANATNVYIEKNGQKIASFKLVNNTWEADNSNLDVGNILNDYPFVKPYFDSSNFNVGFTASMKNEEYGDLLSVLDDNGLTEDNKNKILNVMPLALTKSGTTTYSIVATDINNVITRYVVSIARTPKGWEVISPTKLRVSDPYIIVNTNSVPVKIFAENATKVAFGKTVATVKQTSNPDFRYDDRTRRILPQTYYVFEATVSLKPGLNKIAYTVEINGKSNKDELLIYNANSPVNGAEFRDVLGKKTTFTAFDKNLELKFPKGTVLLSPPSDRPGDEIRDVRSQIYVDVPLYFGVADRTTGQISELGGTNPRMMPRLELPAKFSYASPLYYIDAGDTSAPGGRDPYYADDNDDPVEVEGHRNEFADRYYYNLVPSNRGTLTIKYDPSIVNATKNNLTVFYHDGSYNGWQNLGGVVDVSKKTITVPLKGFGYYMVMKTRELFDDMLNHPYARVDLETLFAKGIMEPYPYGSGNDFGVYMPITRGEMAQMIVKALDLPINAGPYSDPNGLQPLQPTFIDVTPSRNSWDFDYKYIETAARAGIINGKNPGFFEPYEYLTRQEAAMMIARAMNLKLAKSPEDADKKLAKSFTDSKDIGYYAKQAVEAVTNAGIMLGVVNDPKAAKPTYSFQPTATLTRAEMAVITVRMMIQLKKLPKP